jgi:hypothetical protein
MLHAEINPPLVQVCFSLPYRRETIPGLSRRSTLQCYPRGVTTLINQPAKRRVARCCCSADFGLLNEHSRGFKSGETAIRSKSENGAIAIAIVSRYCEPVDDAERKCPILVSPADSAVEYISSCISPDFLPRDLTTDERRDAEIPTGSH